MEQLIDQYVIFLKDTKKSRANTVASYKRDLMKFNHYFMETGITDIKDINETKVNSYVLYIEKQGMSAATDQVIL